MHTKLQKIKILQDECSVCFLAVTPELTIRGDCKVRRILISPFYLLT